MRTIKAKVRTGAVRVALGALLGLSASACAVTQPIAVVATDLPGNPTQIDAVDMTIADKPEASNRFGQALVSAFADAGVARTATAGLVADYGLSLAPASTAIVDKPRETDPANPAAPARTIVLPRKGSPLDKCAAQRMKATLSLFDRATGELRYRGEGSAIECAFAPDDEAAMAAALVSDAMENLVR